MNQEKAFMGLQVRFRRLCALVLAFACLAVVGGQQAHVNPANLRFVKEHKAELEKLKKPSED
jgi:cell division protein FtsB